MGFRDTGQPFWGESMKLYDAMDVSGSALGFNGFSMLAYRGAPQASLVAGNKINAWVNGSTSYLMEDDEVEYSWVIECSGSGTLNVKEGIDASGDAGDVTVPAPPSDLGTHTISGVTTLVLGSSYTQADYWHPTDWNVAVSLIECVSGAVEIQQVKMRIFPTDGVPLGGPTEPIADAEVVGNGAIYYGLWDADSGTQEAADFDSLWAETIPLAQAAFASGPVAANPVTTGYGSIATGGNYVDRSGAAAGGGVLDAGTFVGSAGIQRVMAWITRPAITEAPALPATGTERTDWIRNPYEVIGDPYAFCSPTGALDVTWLDLELAHLVTGEISAPVNLVIEESSGPPYFASGSNRWPVIGSTLDSYTVSGAGWIPLGDYSAASIRLSLYSSLAEGAPGSPTPTGDPGTGQSAGHTYAMGVRTVGTDATPDWPGPDARCQYRYQRSAYTVWSPVMVPDSEFPPVFQDGYYLDSLGNLTGLGDGADVWFG